MTRLPLLHIVLFTPVLLDEILQHFLQAVGICLQSRQNIADGSLDEHPIDHPETLTISGQWSQRLQHEPKANISDPFDEINATAMNGGMRVNAGTAKVPRERADLNNGLVDARMI